MRGMYPIESADSSCSKVEKRKKPLAAARAFLALALAIAVQGAAFAQEREFPERNCAITPPEGWGEVKDLPSKSGILALYANPEKTSLLILLLDEKNSFRGEMDDRFVTGFEKGVESSGGGKKISGKFIEVEGIRSYERLGTLMVDGAEASTLMRAIPADGKFYHVQAIRYDGKAEEDPEIRQGLESFRFLKAPAPPGLNSPAFDKGYQIGYLIGKMIVPVALVLFLLMVIGGTGIALFFVFRKKDKTTEIPPIPPA